MEAVFDIMKIDFQEIPEQTIPGMNGGTGEISARIYADDRGKVIPCSIHPGGSIGMHTHLTGDDLSFVLAGSGTAVCDGQEERLEPGTLHICRQGSSHSIRNTGLEDLVMLTVVTERT